MHKFKLKIMMFVLGFLLINPIGAMSAGTLTPSKPKHYNYKGYQVTEYLVTATADASGDVSIDLVDTGITGKLKEIRFVTGTAASTTDIYIYDRNDANKTDLLGNQGVNIGAKSVALPLRDGAYTFPDILGDLYLTVAEAGDGGTGTFIIVIGY